MGVTINSFDDLYRRYYKDDIASDKERERLVGELMMPALKNNREAVTEIIELMIDPSFAVVRNAMFEKGNLYKSLDLMEDMMQEVAEIVQRCFFRGIPETVAEGELLKYLLGAVRNATRQKLQRNYEKEAKNPSLEKEEEDGVLQIEEKEQEEPKGASDLKDEIITYFVKCLTDEESEPHKVITYSYASLLPMIFKGTQNEEVLQEMDQMSGRYYKKKTSSFQWNERKERFELTGEISRSSGNLMKWAVDAMWGMTVDFLQNEVQETYNMEPIGNTAFAWGKAFRRNLVKDYNAEMKEKDVVITSEFTVLSMKNWPLRLGASLYKKTREHFMNEDYYECVASQYNRKRRKREGESGCIY